MAKKPTYAAIKKLTKEGLNVNEIARKLGCTRDQIMKTIKENFRS